MSVFSVYVISESGSLQFYYEHTTLNTEVEKKFNFPLPFVFKVYNSRIVVDFGATEDVKIGYAVCAVDQIPAKGIHLEDGREILQVMFRFVLLWPAVVNQIKHLLPKRSEVQIPDSPVTLMIEGNPLLPDSLPHLA